MLCTTPKSFRTTVKESLKRTTTSKWATLTKSRIVRRVKYFHAFLSTLNYLPSVQKVIEFTNWIPKIIVHFCYLRLYFGIFSNVCRRLLQWIARIKNGLTLRPTTRYRTYSNQISTRLIPIRWWKCRRRWLWSSLRQDMHDHVGKIGTRSWLVRLDLWGWCHWWLYDLYFQLLMNCTVKPL